MNTTPFIKRQHSAKVSIELLLDGMVMNVAELGSSHVVIRNPTATRETQGEIRVTIDGRLHAVRATFPTGIDPSAPKQFFIRPSDGHQAIA